MLELTVQTTPYNAMNAYIAQQTTPRTKSSRY